MACQNHRVCCVCHWGAENRTTNGDRASCVAEDHRRNSHNDSSLHLTREAAAPQIVSKNCPPRLTRLMHYQTPGSNLNFSSPPAFRSACLFGLERNRQYSPIRPWVERFSVVHR